MILFGLVITCLWLATESAEKLTYCDLEAKLCSGQKHVACNVENISNPMATPALLDYKTRLYFLEAINKNRKLMKIKWDAELETLSDRIDFSAKNICFTSMRFVDINSIIVKYCVYGDDFSDSVLTTNGAIESIGCTIQAELTEITTKKCFLLDCLYNFSNRSTMLAFNIIPPQDAEMDNSYETDFTSKLQNYYRKLQIDGRLEDYDLWLFWTLVITVWLANLCVLIFVCSLMNYLRKFN